MRRIIAVVGLSGVGKSTLINRVGAHLPMLHLQASDLIRKEQAFRQERVSSSEQLRLGAVLGNQTLLVDGFRRTTTGFEGLIVIDGHTLIDGKDGPVEITSEVFRALGCNHVLVIEDDPGQILERRRADSRRTRPLLPVEALGEQQRQATRAAERMAAGLGIPISVLRASAFERIEAIITGR